MGAIRVVRLIVLSLVVFAWSVAAVLAQGVGAIAGSVTDASGAVLPGVTVTLTSAQGTVGGNQEVLTDERGAYQFLRLVPGSYSVRAVLQGFRPFTQTGIIVNSDQTSRAGLVGSTTRSEVVAPPRRTSSRVALDSRTPVRYSKVGS